MVEEIYSESDEDYYKRLAIVHALAMEDKYERDKITGLQEATERGKKEGIEIEKIEIAKSLLNDGMSIEFVSKHTGLTLEEIEKVSK